MRRLIPLLAIGTIVAACASPPPPTPPATAAVVRVADAEPPFGLVFELPRSTWGAGEAIEGTVSLRVAAGGPSTVYGSGGGLFMFTYRELNGTRFVEPVADAACAPHAITPGAPITKPLGKSGAWNDNDPDEAFVKTFLAGPDVRLPAGDWAVTVAAVFSEGLVCDGFSHDLTATIEVHITD